MRSLSMIRPFSLAAMAALVLACGDKGDDPAASGGDTDSSGTSDSGSAGSSSSASDSNSDSNSGSDTNGGTSTTGNTSDSTSGTSTSDGSGETGSFIEPPDGGVVGQCDPGLQDCPNENDKCTAYTTMPGTCCVDANKCVPVMGTGVAGDDCTRTEENDDCAKGFFCTTKTSGSTGMGFCEQMCVAGDDTSCDKGTCIVYNDGVLPLCRVECDPLLQDCDPGFGCYPAQDTFVCGKPANNDGEGDDGSPCSTLRSCLPGLACVTGTAVSGCAADGVCCTPFCDLSGPDPCTDPAEDCVAWFTAGNAPPQYINVGACLIPQ
jgi:hypothetical protein